MKLKTYKKFRAISIVCAEGSVKNDDNDLLVFNGHDSFKAFLGLVGFDKWRASTKEKANIQNLE